MAGFLAAHGYDPGPTQRPLLAGAISGLVATIPAVAILAAFGSLAVEARILGMTQAQTLGAGAFAMAAAGAVYARTFGRAANDVRGGWLFGMTFGFALWTAGGVLVLPLLSGGTAPAGKAAVGLFLSFVAWGAALGVVHPFVHRPLHESLASGSKRREVGPAAATGRRARSADVRPQRAESPRQPPP
ncbi:MAG: hypothetical protein ACJ8D5_05790 [Sphingomicrobium sp.]